MYHYQSNSPNNTCSKSPTSTNSCTSRRWSLRIQHPFSFTRLRCLTAATRTISLRNTSKLCWDLENSCFTATWVPFARAPCSHNKRTKFRISHATSLDGMSFKHLKLRPTYEITQMLAGISSELKIPLLYKPCKLHHSDLSQASNLGGNLQWQTEFHCMYIS